MFDSLYSDQPTVRLIKDYGWRYIIVTKDNNHSSLIESVNELDRQGKVAREHKTKKDSGYRHWYRFVNDILLNKSKPIERVNVFHFTGTNKRDKRSSWSWTTDIHLTNRTVEHNMRGVRYRWTLKTRRSTP
ncbi:MAG: hypothetical protein OXC07_04705 [Kistimonas sp.]|nr:hypothetical protein [Kistimonas sp.]